MKARIVIPSLLFMLLQGCWGGGNSDFGDFQARDPAFAQPGIDSTHMGANVEYDVTVAS